MSLLAFCHKALSSPNKGDGEIFLNNWAPEFMQKKKYQVCSFSFSQNEGCPLLQISFCSKPAANGTVFGRIALPLCGQEDLP